MENKLSLIKNLYMEKFGLNKWQLDYDLEFLKLDNGEYLVAMKLMSYNDNIFYLYAPTSQDNLETMPIAQIKFQKQNDNTIFIRRLEFIDNSFKGKGYATKLINMFETFCLKNGYTKIVGEFDPLHGESQEKVKNYYLRNGYQIKMIENKPWISKKLITNDDKNNSSLEL